MQISLALGFLGLSAPEGQAAQALQSGLQRLCPTGVNLPGLSGRDTHVLETLRQGGTAKPADAALAVASLVGVLRTNGFLASTPFENTPGIRLFQDPPTAAGEHPIPIERLSFPSFGGVDVLTAQGPIRFGAPMWSNKDILIAASQKIAVPSVFVQPDFGAHPGLLGFEFLRNNVFVTRKVPTFVTGSPEEARALDDFLRQTYESTEPEAQGAFPSPPHDSLRRIVSFDPDGKLVLEGEGNPVTIERLRPNVYRISEGESAVGVLNLEVFAKAVAPSPIPARPSGRRAEAVRRQAIDEKRQGVWPIGTANGFAAREETSGFMVWNRGRFVLVDPPSSTLDYLHAHRIPLDLLQGIVITHGHTDHCTDAVPRLLEARPNVKLYTTRRIFDDIVRQLELALGKRARDVDFGYRRFVEARPRATLKINGMRFRFHETLHSLPSLGFEVWNGKNLVLHFSGDTFADPSVFSQFLPGQTPFMTRERAFEVLRHYLLIPQTASQAVKPLFLIEAGVPPLHTAPELTRAYLDYLSRHLKIDVSRVLVYHISDAKAREARLKKWAAGHEGWIDLSPHYP